MSSYTNFGTSFCLPLGSWATTSVMTAIRSRLSCERRITQPSLWLKLAATWFRFTRFNGRRSNIFGAPPGAPATDVADLNAFFVSASVAF